MPLASDGRLSFPVKQTSAYGRTMLAKQQNMHDKLVMAASGVVHDRMPPIYMRQIELLAKAERFKPSYNQMKQRCDDDIVMANLIRDATARVEHRLDGHVQRFRELRAKFPNHLPNRQEQYETDKMMEMHERVVRAAPKCIDNESPHKALHFRKIMRGMQYTSGGFPRPLAALGPKPTKRRRRRRKGRLPGRRTSMGFTEESEYDDDDGFEEEGATAASAHGRPLSNQAPRGVADGAATSPQPQWALPNIQCTVEMNERPLVE